MLNRGEIQLSSVVFDIATGDVRDASGDRVELRKKSTEVLARLAEQPGQIVSKAEIMDAVWQDVTVSEESLTQCIADIRRAIGDKDQRVLETHVGRVTACRSAPLVRNVRPDRSLKYLRL